MQTINNYKILITSKNYMHMKKFKIYIQHDAMDCGITCLRMVCKHYGAEYGSEYLSRLCFATNEGVSLLGMSDAAERLGLQNNYATFLSLAYYIGTKITLLYYTA